MNKTLFFHTTRGDNRIQGKSDEGGIFFYEAIDSGQQFTGWLWGTESALKTLIDLIGDKLVRPRSFNIGVAVQIEDGVVVPVVRQLDHKPLRELIGEYDDLVMRARRRRLTEDDCRGGIATVTNFGTFGLTLGTPIPLPNETIILGIGAGVKKPVWSS